MEIQVTGNHLLIYGQVWVSPFSDRTGDRVGRTSKKIPDEIPFLSLCTVL